jgi:hypothetical protein
MKTHVLDGSTHTDMSKWACDIQPDKYKQCRQWAPGAETKKKKNESSRLVGKR